MSNNTVEFYFRVWLPAYDTDPPHVEVWYHGFETSDSRFFSEWAKESFSENDFWYLFSLDKEKYWQIIGKAQIQGHFDYWGEYDEDTDILEIQTLNIEESEFYKMYPY